MPGIFLAKGMDLGIHNFRIGVSETGELSHSMELRLHYDVTPKWLSIALGHLRDTKARHAELMTAWAGTDEDAKFAALEREFESAMQAVCMSAFAVDAFYDVLRHRVNVPDTLSKTWRENRTARYRQVCEVIRLAFEIDSQGFETLRKIVKHVFFLRDLAVHPPGAGSKPMRYPELDVAVEMRFAAFRLETAEQVFKFAAQVLAQQAGHRKPRNEKVKDYAEKLYQKLVELGITWTPDNQSSSAANGNASDLGRPV